MGIGMTKSLSSKETIKELCQAIESVTEGGKEKRPKRGDCSDTMNIEFVQEHIPMSSSRQCQCRTTKGEMLGQMVKPLSTLKGGLTEIPQEILRQNLQPIIHALKKLDAEQLLGLERSSTGPLIRNGVRCRPIYNSISPEVVASDVATGQSCVRYLHIAETPDQYSIGVFVFAPHSRIPLHDHPEMCVLSRVLYGDLQRVSLDLVREEEDDEMMLESSSEKNKRSNWHNGWAEKVEAVKRKLPKGTKQAYKNHADYLQAPDVTVLFPYEGNLHEFVAGPEGAAVLDILLPPYDNERNRDCTFYDIWEPPSSWPKPPGKDPVFIIPTGQPEDFHCISGSYRDLGDTDDYE